jgi:hypothetical protein
MDEEASTPDQNPEQVIQGALVESRAEAAYQLKIAGRSLSEIADELGYRSDVEVAHALKQRFAYEAQFLSEAGRTSLIQLEYARLEALHTAYYQGAIAGDREDAKLVLATHDRRVKLLQLDAVDTATQGHTVLVVSGAEQSYVDKLRALTDE